MIYLDAAATTFQKPRTVAAAVERAMHYMTTPGRGAYQEARLAAEAAFRCRSEAAALFHVPSEDNVVFTFNATHALNIAVKTLVRPGDSVVVSGYEHNAVMRPLYAIGNVQIKTAPGVLFDPQSVATDFARAITPEVRAVFCTHVSNVFGFVLPVDEIAVLCRSRGVPLVIDASQSAGVLPVDLQRTGAAFIGMPGHKGLYGPQGTGLLLCGTEKVKPLMEGGTGSMSMLREMPPDLPDRLEAGTQNIPGIAGLLEGMRFVRRTGLDVILRRESELIHLLAKELHAFPEIRVFSAQREDCQSGVLSFLSRNMDCEQMADRLSERGIAVRAGLHCAPLAHDSAGTFPMGTVRVSVSAFNTERDIALLLDALRAIRQGI